MSTITREFTKEQLIVRAKARLEHMREAMRDHSGSPDARMDLHLAEIALASLEAEAVCQFIYNNPYEEGYTEWLDCNKDYFNGVPEDCRRILYTAPTAPVSVPDGHIIVPLKPTKNMLCAAEYERGSDWQDSVDIWDSMCRAAMLQGADQPQNPQQNIPEKILGGLVEAVNNLLNNDGSRGRYSAMGCGEAREKIELWLAQSEKGESQRSENLADGNSPVIPDGWVMVPVEPTEHMIVEGFESWPDEFFSDTEVWEAFQEMSGCQQSAHLAKLCWAAMLAAAPQQEVIVKPKK